MHDIKYSEKELALFKALGFGEHYKNFNSVYLLYISMAVEVFKNGEESNYTYSLRQCLNAFDKGVFRLTKEFDDLIQLD